MSKIYFDDKVSNLTLQITESYIQYGSEIIPTSALSYFAVKRDKVSWWLTILFLVAGFVLVYYGYSNGGILSFIGFICLILGAIEAVATFLESRKRYVIITAHSGNCIRLEIKGSQHQQGYEPLMKALFEVVEENNAINLKASSNHPLSNK